MYLTCPCLTLKREENKHHRVHALDSVQNKQRAGLAIATTLLFSKANNLTIYQPPSWILSGHDLCSMKGKASEVMAVICLEEMLTDVSTVMIESPWW